MKSHREDHAVFMPLFLFMLRRLLAIIINLEACRLIDVNQQEHADIDIRFRTMAILYVRNTSNFEHRGYRVPAGALRAD